MMISTATSENAIFDLADRHVHRPVGLPGDRDILVCAARADREAGPLSGGQQIGLELP